VLNKKALHRFADMVTCTILNQDEMRIGFMEDLENKLGVRIGVESLLLTFEKEFAGIILYQAKDLIAFADS